MTDQAAEARVRAWLEEAGRVVVLTGAGVSAESGVPTFRDALTGFWARYSPEELATEAAFRAHPQRVWDWYLQRRQALLSVRPNAGHVALARHAMMHPGQLTLVTQNVDGLHQQAGQAGTLALHGDIQAERWLDEPRTCCHQLPPQPGRPPSCSVCGNLRRPDVVWFGESLPWEVLAAAERAADNCELMLVVGTAGAVYPAAGLVHRARRAGARVVVVNPAATELDSLAHVRLVGTSAAILPRILDPAER
ncbi:MAG TPA: NAD-dependent deacylase [Hydrogenophaga sp.]|uniref:SIR2 family NAD-dependent protein deacylase n=1 Tax=Hydrogenophaga sp. TaxID=1904254 RepID=UPI002CD11C11|nr:NAD-dependent deacylase [Hydrogenophaga sp.]HMN91838.1 NAD-dependent deacylase [Hydrogenophaga sp.]HMP09022.1 NAD-dependent deacylase [Hydrogenophaga sp.]